MIRLLIVDRARLMCDAIAAALKDQQDIVIAGVATQLAQAVSLLPQCNLVLASVGLPDDGVFELIREAGRSMPPVKVLVTGPDEDGVLTYLEAGAAGYILREESVEDLLQRLRGVHQGLPALSPRVTAALMARLTELARSSSRADGGQRPQDGPWGLRNGPARLTVREQQVLTLLGQGMSNLEIAQKLAIETGTVKNHVHSILRKLKVSSRYQAALSVAPSATPLAAAFASSLVSIQGMVYQPLEQPGARG